MFTSHDVKLQMNEQDSQLLAAERRRLWETFLVTISALIRILLTQRLRLGRSGVFAWMETHQWTELHDQQVGGDLCALGQALQQSWMLEFTGEQKD